MQRNLAVDHLPFALANPRHVGRDGTGDHRAELCGVLRQVGDPGTPNLIFAGQAGNVGTGAPDPPALHDGSPPPRSRHVPSEQLATLSTAEDQDFKPFWLRHELPPRPAPVDGTPRRKWRDARER